MNILSALSGMPMIIMQTSVWDDQTVLLWLVTGFVFITMILVLLAAVFLLQLVRTMARDAAEERARRMGVSLVEEPSFWDRFSAWTNRSVPVEKEETILLDHNYDGIRELDNHLPPWWKWLFYATIVWGGAYLFTYHISGTFPSQVEEYDTEVAIADEAARQRKSTATGPVIDETNVEVATDGLALADGKSTFASICSSCHRMDGGGDIGPNLTDVYWKHGGDIRSIYKVVSQGIPGTNMVAWGASLSPEKIRNVSSYLLTLQGTDPPNAKKPEGEPVRLRPEPAPSDTMKTKMP